MNIKAKFLIQEIVFLKTDPEQLPRMVTGIVIRQDTLLYCLGSGANESSHYEFEISKEKTFIL